MRRRILLALALALALGAGAWATAASAEKRDPEALARTGKWIANFDKDSCQLIAQFGTGRDRIVTRFTRYEPGHRFDLVIYGRRLATSDVKSTAKIDFGLKGEPISEDVVMGKIGDSPAVFFTGLRLDGFQRKSRDGDAAKLTPELEAQVSGVAVAVRSTRAFRLNSGSMGKPMEMMRKCTSGLVESWGYDPLVQASLSRSVKPTSSPDSWLISEDFPRIAQFQGHNGMVQFRLDVDAIGKVTACHILAATEPDDFADATCRGLTRRARLQPALDAQQRPVRSFYVGKVRWMARG